MSKIQNQVPYDDEGRTPIQLAANKGNLRVCHFFFMIVIQDITQREKIGYTPLYFAAKEGHLFAFAYILDKVADKNSQDMFGSTPLHLAARYGHLQIFHYMCQYLMDKNEDINRMTFAGYTPFHFADKQGQLRICLYILDPTSPGGKTALHIRDVITGKI
jgi:ankyrin repeat protein